MSVEIASPRLRLSTGPRETLNEHFPKLGELPLSGGWGYDRDSAIVIDKYDPVVDSTLPFNGVAIEYLLVEKRLYEELIIQRVEGDSYSGIEWKLNLQSLVEHEGRTYDVLEYDVTAFHDSSWDALKAEWDANSGFADDPEGAQRHQKKREALRVRFSTVYWFDITSFYGQNTYTADGTQSSADEPQTPEVDSALIKRLETLTDDDLIHLRDSEEDPEFIRAVDRVLTQRGTTVKVHTSTATGNRLQTASATSETPKERHSRFAILTWIVLSFLGIFGLRTSFHTIYPLQIQNFADLHIFLAAESVATFLVLFIALLLTFFVIFTRVSLRANLPTILVLGSLLAANHVYTNYQEMGSVSVPINPMFAYAGPLGAWGVASLLIIVTAWITQSHVAEPSLRKRVFGVPLMSLSLASVLVLVGLDGWADASKPLPKMSAHSESQNAAPEASPAVISDATELVIHPLCLEVMYFQPDDFDMDKPINCTPDLTQSPVERNEWEDEGRTHVRYTADFPRMDDGGFAGFMSYEVYKQIRLDDDSRGLFVTVTYNGGGTGHFGKLALLVEEANGDMFLVWFRGTGDRCNDGYPIIERIERDALIYSTAATPFRLLNPFDDANWRFKRIEGQIEKNDEMVSHLLGGWRPYDDIANSAASCAGRRLFSVDLATFEPTMIGVEVDTERWLDDDQGALQVCVNGWLASLIQHHPDRFESMVDLESWVSELMLLEEICR